MLRQKLVAWDRKTQTGAFRHLNGCQGRFLQLFLRRKNWVFSQKLVVWNGFWLNKYLAGNTLIYTNFIVIVIIAHSLYHSGKNILYWKANVWLSRHTLVIKPKRKQCDQIGRFLHVGQLCKAFGVTINFPKSPTLLGNFCKGVRSIIFYWNHFG